MRRSCHDDFGSPLWAQVRLIEEVGSFPARSGECEADPDGCEAAMEQIQSGLVGLRCAPVGVRVVTDHLRGRSAGCDPVSDDNINPGKTYQQLQSSYDARR